MTVDVDDFMWLEDWFSSGRSKLTHRGNEQRVGAENSLEEGVWCCWGKMRSLLQGVFSGSAQQGIEGFHCRTHAFNVSSFPEETSKGSADVGEIFLFFLLYVFIITTQKSWERFGSIVTFQRRTVRIGHQHLSWRQFVSTKTQKSKIVSRADEHI